MWSDVWPAMDEVEWLKKKMDGVVCLSILLEEGVMVSNNLTKWRQNGFKFVTRVRKENFISNEIVIYTIFFYDR